MLTHHKDNLKINIRLSLYMQISLKEFRQDVAKYAAKVAKGQSLVVTKRAKPMFRVEAVHESEWEEVIDFTKLRRGGVDVDELLSRLRLYDGSC